MLSLKLLIVLTTVKIDRKNLATVTISVSCYLADRQPAHLQTKKIGKTSECKTVRHKRMRHYYLVTLSLMKSPKLLQSCLGGVLVTVYQLYRTCLQNGLILWPDNP